MRALTSLSCCLLLCSCITTRGRVNPTATAAVWGGVMVLGGAMAAAGQCEPDAEHCDTVGDSDPVLAGGLIVGGVALLGLAYLMHETDDPR